MIADGGRCNITLCGMTLIIDSNNFLKEVTNG